MKLKSKSICMSSVFTFDYCNHTFRATLLTSIKSAGNSGAFLSCEDHDLIPVKLTGFAKDFLVFVADFVFDPEKPMQIVYQNHTLY